MNHDVTNYLSIFLISLTICYLQSEEGKIIIIKSDINDNFTIISEGI